MRVYLLFLFAGIIYGLILPANIDKAKIDTESSPMCRAQLNSRLPQPATVIDSSINGFALWTQIQECIGYNPIVDAIQIVNKDFLDGRILNVHQAPGALSYWVHDNSVYIDGFRYPNSIASGNPSGNGPHICFGGVTFGGAIYEYGGWFSSLWGMPVQIGSSITRVIGKQLPDGNILFIIAGGNLIGYKLYPPDLSEPLNSGILASGMYYWGYDINGGIAYVFYYDDNLNIYYRSTTNGINWSSQQPYNMVWPNPYPNNVIGWTQMAVTDDGNPLLVFDNWNGDDNTYPYYSRVYVSHTSGQPCVEVSSSFAAPDTECVYPTIATGGNKAAVLYCMPRNNEPDSLNWWDFYVVWSTDNGRTWGTPINYTQSLANRPGLPQLAKRIDTLRNRVYYVYAVDMVRNIDPYWHLISGGLDPMYICFDYANYVGIEEGQRAKVKVENAKLNVLPNIVNDNARIQYAIPERQKISLNLYDIIGRKIETIAQGVYEPGVYTVNHDFSKFSSGIYFLILEGEKGAQTQKILILR